MLKRARFSISPMSLIFFLALSVWSGRSIMGQSRSTSVSAIAIKAGIALEPFPHVKETSLLTLPADVPLPEEMTSPKQGSIYAVQLNQERKYWLKQIVATPALRDSLW